MRKHPTCALGCSLNFYFAMTLRLSGLVLVLQMSSRLAQQRCVDECAAIQAAISSILKINDERLNAAEKRTRFDDLQSSARRHLQTLKSYIDGLEQSSDFSSAENRRKINAIENQYASFLVSFVLIWASDCSY